MTIPVSTVVDVAVTIGATFPARAGFGTLNIVTAELGVIGLSERIRLYNNASGVAEDWPSNSEVVAAANTYFSQQPRPVRLKVSVRANVDSTAQLFGGVYANTPANITALQAITTGSFEISIDGVSEDILLLDFSSIVTLADAATVIEVVLQAVASGGYTAATCTYDTDTQKFSINSGTSGSTSTITTAAIADMGVDVSGTLKLNTAGGALANQGVDAETITESLDAIEDVDTDWYGLTFTKEVRDDVIINGEASSTAAASWVEARTKVFFNTTNDAGTLDILDTTDISSVLKLASYRRTISTYSSSVNQYPSVSLAARAFTVNFDQPNSTITLKFKQLPAITVENLSQNQKNVIDSKNCNALIDVGNSFMFAESFMANGVFLDEVHGIDWLQNAIQTNIFGYLLVKPKVPYTDKGVAALEQQLIKALDEGVRNGLLAAGTTIDGRFLANGYETITVPVALINQSDVEARHYPGLGAIALGAGAIHSVQVNILFER